MRIWISLLSILIVALSFSGCQKNIHSAEILKPNWSETTIKATGVDKLPKEADSAADRLGSLQRAKTSAFSNLKEAILKTMITDSKTVGEYIKDKDAAKGQVEDFIGRGKITAIRHIPNDSIEVDIELYLGRTFESIILQK
ncbi:MAG: hypothetical protein HZA06_07160 [Nitrospirae bacterium]|nr:hypothetical protein [Nitrospirota bacterium]